MNKLDVSRATLEDLKNAWLETQYYLTGTLMLLELGYGDGDVELRRRLLDSIRSLRVELDKIDKELRLRERLQK